MSKLGQKEAVIQEVLAQMPTFQKGIDNAILVLSNAQLESIKTRIQVGITAGTIEYSKDTSNQAEVRTYSRSMVMNHLKKAKELNGGHKYVSAPSDSSTSTKTVRVKEQVVPKGIDLALLPEELHDFAKSLK